MYPGLNGFRALAFLAVFFFHTYKLHAGYLGVNAFFVLSGFLLTPIILDMKDQLPRRSYFSRFYGRRALRIFPLYYFYLAIMSIVCYLVIFHTEFSATYHFTRFLDQVPLALLFLIDFAQAGAGYENTRLLTHFWSLAVEEQFYLVWPCVLLLVSRDKLRGFLLGLVLAGPFVRWFIASPMVAGAVPLLNEDTSLLVYTLPFSHVDGFALGGYFALYRKGGSGISVWLLLLIAYGMGVTTAWLTTGVFTPSELGYGPFMNDSAKHIWGYSLLNLVFANALVHIRDRRFLPILFENRTLDYLGKISYGLYVYHFACILGVNLIMPNWPEPVRIAVALALTLLLGTASYEYLEKRFLKLKDRYFPRAARPVRSEGTAETEPTVA